MTAARPTHLILTLSKQRPKKGSIFFPLLPDNLLPKIPEETTCSNNGQPVSLLARPSAVQNSSYRWTWSWADSLHVFESEEADEGEIKRADGFLAQPHWKIIFIQPTVLPSLSLCRFFFLFFFFTDQSWGLVRTEFIWRSLRGPLFCVTFLLRPPNLVFHMIINGALAPRGSISNQNKKRREKRERVCVPVRHEAMCVCSYVLTGSEGSAGSWRPLWGPPEAGCFGAFCGRTCEQKGNKKKTT